MLTPDGAQQSGRTLVCGLSYLQRITRGGEITVWYPHADYRGTLPPQLDWVAVKQIEILQESSNNLMESFDLMNRMECMKRFAAMRGGGQRLVVITAGLDKPPPARNEKGLFDQTLTSRLRRMDRILWLDDFSREASRLLQPRQNNLATVLPHVYTTLNAATIFNRRKTGVHEQAIAMLERITAIPAAADRIDHSIMVGLKMPKNALRQDRCFRLTGDLQYIGFMDAIASTFRLFHATAPTAMHLRSYGDHMKGRWAHHRPACEARGSSGLARAPFANSPPPRPD